MNNRYRRGADFERELISLFWEVGWSAVRAAGSGTTAYPVPDVVAFGQEQAYVIECKTTAKDRLSLKAAATNLARFTEGTDAVGLIAIKFLRRGFRFYYLDWLARKGSHTITDKDPYLSFDALVGAQRQLAP